MFRYDDVGEISFTSSGYIKVLCPIDRNTDANGNTVPEISDWEFNTILNGLSPAPKNTMVSSSGLGQKERTTDVFTCAKEHNGELMAQSAKW